MIWLRLHVGGRKITVHIVRRKHRLLEGNDGIYHPDRGEVYIARDLEEGPREDVLLHELDHVINDVSGVNRVLGELVPSHALDAAEEQIVSCRTTVWHRLLKDLGFRFPRGITS